MAILVTGGAGYIGSHVAKRLAKLGREFVIFDNLSQGYQQAVKWGKFEKGDLRNIEDLRRVFQKYPDINEVMHFGASCLVGESMSEPVKYYQNNVIASYNLLNAAVEAKIKRFIFSSTCASYGVPDKIPIAETAQQRPISVYGRTKYIFEWMLMDYAPAYNFNYVAFRYFNAAGADAAAELGEKHDPESHLIPRVIEVGIQKDEILSIFGNDYETADGTCVRDYINVEDIADAHVKGLDFLAREKRNEVFNLGCGTGYSVMEIVHAVEKALGNKIKYSIEGRRAGDPPILIGDYTKAKGLLDWMPKRSDLETIVNAAVKWRLSNEYKTFIH